MNLVHNPSCIYSLADIWLGCTVEDCACSETTEKLLSIFHALSKRANITDNEYLAYRTKCYTLKSLQLVLLKARHPTGAESLWLLNLKIADLHKNMYFSALYNKLRNKNHPQNIKFSICGQSINFINKTYS